MTHTTFKLTTQAQILIFYLQDQDIRNTPKRDSQVNYFRLAYVTRYVPDMYDLAGPRFAAHSIVTCI